MNSNLIDEIKRKIEAHTENKLMQTFLKNILDEFVEEIDNYNGDLSRFISDKFNDLGAGCAPLVYYQDYRDLFSKNLESVNNYLISYAYNSFKADEGQWSDKIKSKLATVEGTRLVVFFFDEYAKFMQLQESDPFYVQIIKVMFGDCLVIFEEIARECEKKASKECAR